MASACAQSNTAITKVSVLADGRLLLNGLASNLAEIDVEFQRQSSEHGVVWYYRESTQAEPPPQAMEVMELVIKHSLPVSMSTQPDFSDVVGPDGQPHPRGS